MKWINELNSTTLHIVVGCVLAIIFVVVAMVADMIGHAVSTGTQTTLSLFILAMVGVGAGGFVAKRVTDTDYVNAVANKKSAGATRVTVNTPPPADPKLP